MSARKIFGKKCGRLWQIGNLRYASTAAKEGDAGIAGRRSWRWTSPSHMRAQPDRKASAIGQTPQTIRARVMSERLCFLGGILPLILVFRYILFTPSVSLLCSCFEATYTHACINIKIACQAQHTHTNTVHTLHKTQMHTNTHTMHL